MTVRTGETRVPALAQDQGRHVPGEPGLWILLFGDATVFTVLFCVYLHARGAHPAAFAAAQGGLDRGLGILDTFLLLTSSLLVALAARGLQARARRPGPPGAGTAPARRAGEHAKPGRDLVPWLVSAAIVLGLGFAAGKGIEYHALLAAGHAPKNSGFHTYYFALTGLHLAHLTLGLAGLGALLAVARAEVPTPGRLKFIEAAGCFWHMVDLLWIIIFPLVYLVR